jgi:hypothetical protein
MWDLYTKSLFNIWEDKQIKEDRFRFSISSYVQPKSDMPLIENNDYVYDTTKGFNFTCYL